MSHRVLSFYAAFTHRKPLNDFWTCVMLRMEYLIEQLCFHVFFTNVSFVIYNSFLSAFSCFVLNSLDCFPLGRLSANCNSVTENLHTAEIFFNIPLSHCWGSLSLCSTQQGMLKNYAGFLIHG